MRYAMLYLKAISFEFHSPSIGFAFPFSADGYDVKFDLIFPILQQTKWGFFKSDGFKTWALHHFFQRICPKRTCSFTLEILCIKSRISRLQCSIIDMNKAIMFFAGERKPIDFEILTREWRSWNDISFYRLSTTFYDFLFGAKFLLLREIIHRYASL